MNILGMEAILTQCTTHDDPLGILWTPEYKSVLLFLETHVYKSKLTVYLEYKLGGVVRSRTTMEVRIPKRLQKHLGMSFYILTVHKKK